MSPRDLFVRARESGRLWNTLLVFFDAAIVILSTVVAYYTRFDGKVPTDFADWMAPTALISVAVFGVVFALFGLYRLVLRYVGVDTLLNLLAATALCSGGLLIADFVAASMLGERPVPVGVLIIQGLVVFLGAAGARLAARVYLYVRYRSLTDARRVLIIGAGSAGSLLLREIQSRRDLGVVVVGFLDDDLVLEGRTIGGVPVLGQTDDLARIVEERGIAEIMVAMPSAGQDHIRRVLNAAADANVQARIMPALVIARGAVSVHDLRAVDVDDLLGREPTPIDTEGIGHTLTGRVVAVTGAAGSIGSELCRQIMRFAPKRLLLMEIDESRLYELYLELAQIDADIPVMCICDIREQARLDRIFGEHHPEVVLHAAAYKHVPLMEIAPAEAIKTNVMGTRQLLDTCIAHGVERFVLISTDKAVDPANVMGLTKSLAERVMLDAVGRSSMNAVAVRFGNVLGSRGSVVPIFQEQLRHGGPITVTDPSVTRYFMTIPEASRLVLQAQAIGAPGDIFVLEMGDPVKIVDLARKMIVLSGVPAEVEYVGLRPGEKLHETLTGSSEQLMSTEREKIQRVDRVRLPETDFTRHIDALVAAAIADDAEAVAATIELLEPGFSKREHG